MIGLTGAHGAGKTTLATALAEELDCGFLHTSAAPVFRDMGLRPDTDYPLDVRLSVQEEVLRRFASLYQSAEGAGPAIITDRTPLDLVAYTLADIRNKTVDNDALEDRIARYIAECVRLTNKHFSMLVVVQPGIAPVAAHDRASMSPSYVEHYAMLIHGLVRREDVRTPHLTIPKAVLDVERRIEFVRAGIDSAVNRYSAMLNAAKEAGQPIVFH